LYAAGSGGWAEHRAGTVLRKQSGCGDEKTPQVGVLLPTPEPAPVPPTTACSQALALTPELPSAHAGVPLSYESHVAMLL